MARNKCNSVPGGFLDNYRHGDGGETVYLSLTAGFLRLEYDGEEPPLLRRVSLVADRSVHSRAIGNVLELNLGIDPSNDMGTFIAGEGVSGVQWSGGSAYWGHTFDDDSPPSAGKKIEFRTWVDGCIASMINPPAGVLKDVRNRFDLAGSLKGIRAGDEEVRERFWKKCTPRTREETVMILDLLTLAVKKNNGDLLFSCCDPLKRATAGQDLILETVTGLLEKGMPRADYDRSEMQEVLEAHTDAADPGMAERWRVLCGKTIRKLGAESLHAINAGSLFTALGKVPDAGHEMVTFAAGVVSMVESSPEETRNDIKNLHSFQEMKKLAGRQ